jgi:hypothetical protein
MSKTNPFEINEEEVNPEIILKDEPTQEEVRIPATRNDKEYTTDELFDMLISRVRKDVCKRLLKGAKVAFEKLKGNLEEEAFVQKHFTRIIEERINTARKNNN